MPPGPRAPHSSKKIAKSAGLRYVSDTAPGIRRRRSGTAFRYMDPRGRPVRGHDELLRIKSLVIPPGWSDVWICADENGHIQATARDARGRKQYRYHARWREVRDEDKFGRLVAFGRALPRLRARVRKDLASRGLTRDKVLATVVRLLELTLIRVGNEEYVRANASYGLTTLLDRHVRVQGARLMFKFRGKSGKEHEVEVSDKRLAAVIKRCQALPGAELFRYVDEAGTAQSIGSADVNAYLRETMGEDFTAKDFRTWAGSLLAAESLSGPGDADEDADRRVVEAIKSVALRLGNTPATCRKHYVHPAVIAAFVSGRLGKLKGGRAAGLRGRETVLLRVLRGA